MLNNLDFINQFTIFKDEYSSLQNNLAVIDLNTAPDFNVFELMGVTLQELGHSKFLANLLNPRGTHGQGSLFINSFLTYCRDIFPYKEIPEAFEKCDDWRVHTETSFSEGRCDIVVLSSSLGLILVIENKIHAAEQSNQLNRYQKFLTEHKMEYPNQKLFFLTLGGYTSTTALETAYIKISYRRDISCWLNGIMGQIKADGVREVVNQYYQVICRLT